MWPSMPWHISLARDKNSKMRLLTSSFQRKSITHTNTNKLLCEQKKSSTSFSLQLKHLVTTLLKPKNEDFTFSSCLKHIFFITLLCTLPSRLVYWCTTYVIWVYVVLSFLWENFFSVQIPWFFICWIVVIPHRVILQLFFFFCKSQIVLA